MVAGIVQLNMTGAPLAVLPRWLSRVTGCAMQSGGGMPKLSILSHVPPSAVQSASLLFCGWFRQYHLSATFCDSVWYQLHSCRLFVRIAASFHMVGCQYG